MRPLIAVFSLVLCLSANAAAQSGGKAEPRRIPMRNGTAAIAGSLRNGQQIDYVFAAAKGQVVTIRNSSKSQFDFRVYNEEHFPDGDFDSSPSYSFEIPETSDYLFTVRKKATGTRGARYSLRLTIK